MFKHLIAVLVIALAGTSPALAKRVALVIGNGAYEHTVALTNQSNAAEKKTHTAHSHTAESEVTVTLTWLLSLCAFCTDFMAFLNEDMVPWELSEII